MTSAELAQCMGTNAVVVRRTMAGLREPAWCAPKKAMAAAGRLPAISAVTLRDIYAALGAPSLLAVGVHLQSPSCLVEQAVNRALNDAFAEAEALLINRLGPVTLARLRPISAPAPPPIAPPPEGHC